MPPFLGVFHREDLRKTNRENNPAAQAPGYAIWIFDSSRDITFFWIIADR